MIRLSRLDRKNPSAGLAKFYAQRQKARKPRAEPNSFGFCRGAADFIKILWIISRQLRIALQYHDARYLCGGKGASDRTMSTFNFINAASRYHDSPVKQQSQRVKTKQGGIAPGRFPPYR